MCSGNTARSSAENASSTWSVVSCSGAARGEAARVECEPVLAREALEHAHADVVARVRIAWPRVAETDHQLHAATLIFLGLLGLAGGRRTLGGHSPFLAFHRNRLDRR